MSKLLLNMFQTMVFEYYMYDKWGERETVV